ncbi:MAG: sel1 repeat family protein, partial [Hyphomicrobiales bacterium]
VSVVGNIVPKDVKAMLAAWKAGNVAEAQFQLGLMLADGEGGPKDEFGARALFEKAAAQSHVEAMVWAGSFAQRGLGGPEDTAKAKTYFSKAAALGNEDAKAALKRIECPYVLKDKRGQVMTNLCF